MGDSETEGLSAVAEAIAELAREVAAPARMPALIKLQHLADQAAARAEVTRRAWLTLSAALHEAADEAERMAG